MLRRNRKNRRKLGKIAEKMRKSRNFLEFPSMLAYMFFKGYLLIMRARRPKRERYKQKFSQTHQ
jgi:hypothetical protein